MKNLDVIQTNKIIDYEIALENMKNRVDKILINSEKDLIWFLNHDHIYTQGTSSSASEILKKNNLPIFKTNRGGKTTYHGPGQRIIYFMINLNKRKKDIKKFIAVIEMSLIEFLDNYNIEARSFKNRVGIWVIKNQGKLLKKEKKIGAIGLRIKKWITYHGLSFNINPNLKYYNFINACGLSEYKNTSLKELGVKISTEEFDKQYLKKFKENLKKL